MKYKELKTNNKKDFFIKLEKLKNKGYKVVNVHSYIFGFIIMYEALLIKPKKKKLNELLK